MKTLNRQGNTLSSSNAACRQTQRFIPGSQRMQQRDQNPCAPGTEMIGDAIEFVPRRGKKTGPL